MARSLILLPPLLTVVGLFLLTRLGLGGGLKLARALRPRLKRRAVRAIERVMVQGTSPGTSTDVSPTTTRQRPPIAVVCGLAGGVAMALLWRHPLLAPWFLLLGAATGWMFHATRQRVGREDLRTLEDLIATFRSTFVVGQSVFAALEDAADEVSGDGEENALLATIHRATRVYRAELDHARPLAVLRRSRWPHLTRLGVILAHVAYADEQATRRALEDLETQVRRARQLRDRTQAVMTMTRLSLRVLQAANLTALAAVAVFPLWRAYYAARPLSLMALSGMILAGSWFFGARMKRLGELV